METACLWFIIKYFISKQRALTPLLSINIFWIDTNDNQFTCLLKNN